jgi:membrane associated rhomboid family serine protease
VSTRARHWHARNTTSVTSALIAVNLAVFVWSVLADPASLGGRFTSVHQDLVLNEYFLSVSGEWYRLVTAGFLHYGLIHLALNMYLLYMLGQMLEPLLGSVRFSLVYLASLLGGSAGVLLIQPQAFTAGASGAVFGLMGLAFVGYWLNGTNPMNTSIGSLFLLNILLTFMLSDRISVGGHLGGAAAGALCALAVMAPGHRPVPRWATYAGPAAVALVSIAISVAVVP